MNTRLSPAALRVAVLVAMAAVLVLVLAVRPVLVAVLVAVAVAVPLADAQLGDALRRLGLALHGRLVRVRGGGEGWG